MPIIVKEFTWNETETHLFLILKMPGVTTSKLDAFLTDSYLKLNSPPYFWELFLSRKIFSERSQIKVESGNVILTLTKADVGIWKEISAENVTDKNSLMERRRKEIADHQIKTKESQEVKLEKAREQNRDLVLQQIKVENEERKRIEMEKEKEKWETLKEMYKESDNEKGLKDAKSSKSEHIRKIPPPRRSFTLTVQFTPAAPYKPTRECTQTEEEKSIKD